MSTTENTNGHEQEQEQEQEQERFERSVEFVAKDAGEQIAYGAVLVPDELDHQGDFLRAETIRELAADYTERFESGDVYGGVMHAVFSDDIELDQSRVMDKAGKLGTEDYPAGTWVQGYRFDNPKMWDLVERGVLGGYSIGGTAKGVIHEPGTLPDDVRIPDAVQAEFPDDFDRDDIVSREITTGRILETSTVDFPAVARATHQEYKAAGFGLQKGHPALTGSPVESRLYLEGRGHTPEDAKAITEIIQEFKSREPSGWLERAKRFFSHESGGSGGENALLDARAPSETTDAAEKDGRTLSGENIDSAMAVHDAALDMLERSDIIHGRQRFTDDPARDFDVGDYGSNAKDGQQSDESAESDSDSDSDIAEFIQNMDESELNDKFDALADRLDAIEATVEVDNGDGDEQSEQKSEGEKSDDIDEIKAMLSEMQDGGDKTADEEQTTDDLAEIKALVEQMASAQGVSQQADVEGPAGEEKGTWSNSPFAAGGD